MLFYCHTGIFFPAEESLKEKLKVSAASIDDFVQEVRDIAKKEFAKKLQRLVQD